MLLYTRFRSSRYANWHPKRRGVRLAEDLDIAKLSGMTTIVADDRRTPFLLNQY